MTFEENIAQVRQALSDFAMGQRDHYATARGIENFFSGHAASYAYTAEQIHKVIIILNPAFIEEGIKTQKILTKLVRAKILRSRTISGTRHYELALA